MKKIVLISLLTLILLNVGVNAQTTTPKTQKEIGIRVTGLADFNFFYKKQRSENKYLRMRLLSSIITTSKFRNSLALGLTIGSEKRKSLNDKFKVIKGWEFIGLFSTVLTNSTSMVFSPGLGFVLGFQYDINPNFLVNLEMIPSLSSHFQYDSKQLTFSGANLEITTNNIAIGLMYKF